MNRLFAASAALVGLAASAQAADLPPRYAAPVPYAAAPFFTWTGFYAGLHAGWMFGDNDVTLAGERGAAVGFSARGVLPERMTLERDGFMIGGQAGYNVQSGMFVYGVEIDISATDLSGRARRGYIDPVAPGTRSNTTEAKANLNYLGTVRGRVGVTFDRALVYATGGLAYGGIDLKGSIRSASATPAFVTYNGSLDDTQVGFAVGGGVEYAVTNNLTARVEYLYHNLGEETVTIRQPTSAVNAVDYRFENDGHAARVGLNYKF